MRRNVLQKLSPFDVLLTLLALGIFLAFTVAQFFAVPYSGFSFNPTNGEILQFFVEDNETRGLRLGDKIKQIGPVTWEQYYTNGLQMFFEDTQPGQTVGITVLRNKAELTVPWVMLGFNRREFIARFYNIWWLGYFFWFFGMVVQVFMRPKNERWWLLIAINYLTGFWLILGSLSAWRVWYSSILLHSTTWLLLPLYIRFHWIFPKPLGRTPTWAWIALYAASFGLAIGELTLPLPRSLYFVGFLLAVLGSITLFGLHYIRQSHLRWDMGLLLIAFLFALSPSILIGLFGLSGQIPQAGPLALLSLPIMPGAYVYSAYRRQLGGLELRANRLISIYAFIVLLLTIILLVTGTSLPLVISPEALVFSIVAAAASTALLSILIFPGFQAFIERRVLGITLPSQNLSETYSARITTSARLPDLLKLLEEEVFPSLLVRQFAFVRTANASVKVILSKNVASDQVQEDALTNLLASSSTERLLPFSEEDRPLGWIRLVLPLRLDSDLIGAWLLGRRDPDDLYPQAELPILQSLADQTAIALSNILQAERLHKMYADDVERSEKSHQQLALDLHDSVLNELATLRLSVDETHVSPKFEAAYDRVTTRLREIVRNLRPPMLDYGLKPAIEELADDLMERSKTKIKLTVDIQVTGEGRYPENIERHIFRVVQEACQNAVRHSRASQVSITASLVEEAISICIEDNGVGFEARGPADLDILLANKHFGMAGMIERAALIDARVEINSHPEGGTRILILWKVNANVH